MTVDQTTGPIRYSSETGDCEVIEPIDSERMPLKQDAPKDERHDPFGLASCLCENSCGQEDRHPSIQELTSLMVARLEDARKLNSEVDARHVIARVSEGLRRRDRTLEHPDRRDATHDGGRALARSTGELAPWRRIPACSHSRADAVASCLAEIHSDVCQPGIKLSLTKSTASIESPGREGTFNFRNRKALLTIGCPKIGNSYRFQFTSSRMEKCAPTADDGPRLSFGAAACALIAAGILLNALPELRTKQPESLGLSLVRAEKKIAPKPSLPISPPIFAMLPAFPEQKTPLVELTPVATAVPEQVATRTTTNIRARPERRGEVVRVVPGRLILTVYARNEDWFEVGGTQAWGWVPSSLVVPFVPES
jgi:hypothetical protein